MVLIEFPLHRIFSILCSNLNRISTIFTNPGIFRYSNCFQCGKSYWNAGITRFPIVIVNTLIQSFTKYSILRYKFLPSIMMRWKFWNRFVFHQIHSQILDGFFRSFFSHSQEPLQYKFTHSFFQIFKNMGSLQINFGIQVVFNFPANYALNVSTNKEFVSFCIVTLYIHKFYLQRF